MSTTLTHSPADVIRALLVQLGLGVAVDGSSDWQTFATNEPDKPDNCITTFDTEPRQDARLQHDGEVLERYGVQIRVRSTTHNVGWLKAKEIARQLEEEVIDATVNISSSSYTVQMISRTSGVLPMGKEIPQSKRQLFSVNIVAIIVPNS